MGCSWGAFEVVALEEVVREEAGTPWAWRREVISGFGRSKPRAFMATFSS